MFHFYKLHVLSFSKAKRLPKRQLIQSTDGITIECQLEDTTDSLFDFDAANDHEKNLKSKKKKLKDHDLSLNPNELNDRPPLDASQEDHILSIDSSSAAFPNNLPCEDLPTEAVSCENTSQHGNFEARYITLLQFH